MHTRVRFTDAMVTVSAASAEARLKRLDPRNTPVVLLHGPDAGLVNERARALVAAAVPDQNDPFRLVKIDGDSLLADPARLLDEAHTLGLFGRRVVWVRPAARSLAPALEPLLDAPPADALVVVEAGELKPTAPLRVLCERSPAALAIECRRDEGEALEALVDKALAEAGLEAAPEVREALVASLGADRLASRGALEKLVLYAAGRADISLADVEAVVGDASHVTTDPAVDAAFAGDLGGLEAALVRLAAAGEDAESALRAAYWHALTLARASVARDDPAGFGRGRVRGGAARQAAAQRALDRFTSERLLAAVVALGGAVAASRRHPRLADALAERTLMEIARGARR